MEYNCGHVGCDLCGGSRGCDPKREKLTTFSSFGGGSIVACESCIKRAVRFSLRAAETWGGTILDTNKPCAALKEKGDS